MTVTERLLALADAGNAAFSAKLAPGIDPDRVLGCRIPRLRQLARTLYGSPEAAAFLAELPHRYYDENNLHGILLGRIRSTGEALEALERFLPHIDNWATCDITACGMKSLGHDPRLVSPRVERWLADERTYTVRFGIVTLLAHYLGERFEPRHLDLLAALRRGDYYIDMALAWYFSTALVKQFDRTLPYFTDRRLDRRVHDAALQKGRESLRIAPERKALLQRLKYRPAARAKENAHRLRTASESNPAAPAGRCPARQTASAPPLPAGYGHGDKGKRDDPN